MGIRAELYNLSENLPATYLHAEDRNDIPASLRAAADRVRHEGIGETNNTGIPVPWLLYFGREDFQLADVRWDEDTVYRMPMPCTTVAKARERIAAALAVFERIAGDAACGREYWQEALDVLAGLPHPFIALDHAEWIGSNAEDPEEDAAAVARAFEAGAPADAWLIEFCGISEGVRPYTHDEWARLVTRFDPSNERQMNAIAMGYGHARG
jgi:hypothetical protein